MSTKNLPALSVQHFGNLGIRPLLSLTIVGTFIFLSFRLKPGLIKISR
jgi:hypothetical protein